MTSWMDHCNVFLIGLIFGISAVKQSLKALFMVFKNSFLKDGRQFGKCLSFINMAVLCGSYSLSYINLVIDIFLNNN